MWIQLGTYVLSGNHEYYTKSKDTINAEQPDLLSALSKAQSNLMILKYYYFKRQNNQSKGYNN